LVCDDAVHGCLAKIYDRLHQLHYPLSEILGVVCMVIASRSLAFALETVRQMSDFPHWMAHFGIISASVLQLPLRMADYMGTLTSGSVVPKRVLPSGNVRRPNVDASHWCVGSAIRDLTKTILTARTTWNRIDSLQTVADFFTIQDLDVLTACSTAKCLLANHFWSHFVGLGWARTGLAAPTAQGTNTSAFRTAFGKLAVVFPLVRTCLKGMGAHDLEAKLSDAGLATNACQFMNVLDNYLFGKCKHWRSAEKIIVSSAISEFGAKPRRHRSTPMKSAIMRKRKEIRVYKSASMKSALKRKCKESKVQRSLGQQASASCSSRSHTTTSSSRQRLSRPR
jgi:hypothetical protein